MQTCANKVLLLKSQDNDGGKPTTYETMLSENGYIAKTLKVLDFEYINLDVLRQKFNDPLKYSGCIFTSPRTAQAVKLCLDNERINPTWNDLTNYVIGESTKQVVQGDLSMECTGSETGNAANLAALILKDSREFQKPFLYPCGNMKRDTLSTMLESENILLDTLTVYNTIRSRSLELDYNKIISSSTIPYYFIFFSPSGLLFTKELIENNNLVDQVKFICIGKTTAEEMKKIGWNISAVCDKPTPESLLQSIQRL